MSTSDPLFKANDTWTGGFYELAMEVGPRSDKNAESVLSAIWSYPDLKGCFLDRSVEPADQKRVQPRLLDNENHLLGIAHLPNKSHVVCGTCIIREDDGPDWVDFYLPLGCLGRSYPCGGFPFGKEEDWPGNWRFELEDWFAGIGLWVAQSASFRVGLIGFEVSGAAYADEIEKDGIPRERFVGYLFPSSEGPMRYHRRNKT
jgi:hypothetical protein